MGKELKPPGNKFMACSLWKGMHGWECTFMICVRHSMKIDAVSCDAVHQYSESEI